MISERLCDPEDCNNEHLALYHRNSIIFECILKYNTIILKCNNITVFVVFLMKQMQS